MLFKSYMVDSVTLCVAAIQLGDQTICYGTLGTSWRHRFGPLTSRQSMPIYIRKNLHAKVYVLHLLPSLYFLLLTLSFKEGESNELLDSLDLILPK